MSHQYKEAPKVIRAAKRYAEVKASEQNTGSESKLFNDAFQDYLLMAAQGLIFWLNELESASVGQTYLLEKFEVLESLVSVLPLLDVFFQEEIVDLLESEHAQSLEQPKSPPFLIGVVGQISSGKGTVGKILARELEGVHFPLSERLREIAYAQGNGLSLSRAVLREVDHDFKPRFGKDVFVRWTIDLIRITAMRREINAASVDGFRSLEEAQMFKKEGGVLIGVTADQNIRFQRNLLRQRSSDDSSWELFLESDRIENEWIAPILGICDHVINNESDLVTLQADIQQTLTLIRG